jgi:signal transduction histidine kinase
MAAVMLDQRHHFPRARVFDPAMRTPRIPPPENYQAVIHHAEEEERRRIASELRDVTLQELTIIQLGLESIRRAIVRSDEDIERICHTLEASVSAIQRQLRTLSYVLHPPELRKAGLSGALSTFVAGFARRTGIRIRYNDQSAPAGLCWETEMVLYRIAREALFNIVRHGQATDAEVKLVGTARRVTLDVRDNGTAVSKALAASGLPGRAGLNSMREHVAGLSGALTIRRLNRGTLVRAQMPV